MKETKPYEWVTNGEAKAQVERSITRLAVLDTLRKSNTIIYAAHIRWSRELQADQKEGRQMAREVKATFTNSQENHNQLACITRRIFSCNTFGIKDCY